MPISFSLAPELISKKYLRLPTNAQDAVGYQAKLHKRILEVDGPGTKFLILKSFFDFFKEEGIPVFLPAGNNYSTKINMAGLLGAHTIGALNYDRSRVAAYSDQSPFTTIFRAGDILSAKSGNGIDINGDNIPDFLNTEISGGTNVVLNRGSMNIQTLETYSSDLSEFFISSRYFNNASGITNESILNQIDQDFGELVHFPSGHYYRVDKEGHIVFSPITTDIPYIQYNYGTSFSIGNVCN
jgi:hypothetical protein